jgi:hypothetical protein
MYNAAQFRTRAERCRQLASLILTPNDGTRTALLAQAEKLEALAEAEEHFARATSVDGDEASGAAQK